MASFTEQATLVVRDQSTGPLKKINSELKKLFATAKSLKSIKVDIRVNAAGLSKANAELRKLTGQMSTLRRATGAINVRVNTSGASRALNALRAQAAKPIATQAARAQRAVQPRAAHALTGGGPRGIGPFGVHVLSMPAGWAAGLASAMGRAAKEGTKQADIGDYGLDALQLKPADRSLAERTINAIAESERAKPQGALMNRAQIAQTYAETLPVAGYDPEATAWLVKQQSTLVAMEVARGKNLDDAREASVKYIKALELGGRLSNPSGKFDPVEAGQYLDALKQIAPAIGKELTGENVFQFMKYARQARYTMTPEAFQAGLLTAEEMGASSAGVAMNQAVRQLTGQHVPPSTLAELAKQGLVTTKEVKEGLTGKGKRTKTVVGEPLDEIALRQNLWKFANDRLIPAMKAKGLDPNKPEDVAKYTSSIASTQTAMDILTAAINRSAEIQRDLAAARQRDPNLVDAAAGRSLQVITAGLQSQVQGVLGETVTALEPILLPAMKGVSGWLNELGVDIRKASTGDKAAQKAVEDKAKTGLEVGAAAALTKGIVGQTIAAISTPLGVAAGIAGAAAPGAGDTAKSLSLAGVGLNTAAQGLQAAAAAQLAAGGMAGLIGKLLPGLGPLGPIIAGVAGATGYGMYKNDPTKPQGGDMRSVELENQRRAFTDSAAQLEGKRAKDQATLTDLLSQQARGETALRGELIKQTQERIAGYDQQIAAAKTEEANINKTLGLFKEERDPMFPAFWKWLEEQHQRAAQAAKAPPPGPAKPTYAPTKAEHIHDAEGRRADQERIDANERTNRAAEAQHNREVAAKKKEADKAAAQAKKESDARRKAGGFFYVEPPPAPTTGAEPPRVVTVTPDPSKPLVVTPAPGAVTPTPEPPKPKTPFFRPKPGAGGTEPIGPPVPPTTTLANLPAQLATASSSFASVFSTGASNISTAITTGGQSAASTITSAMPGAGQALGNAAANAIRAAVSNISVNVNVNNPGGGKIGDPGTHGSTD